MTGNEYETTLKQNHPLFAMDADLYHPYCLSTAHNRSRIDC